MSTYYFTYGRGGQPFVGGWTEVEAPDYHAACAAFRAFHPDRTERMLDCSDVYSEARFKSTQMYQTGNFGCRCLETITLRRELADEGGLH